MADVTEQEWASLVEQYAKLRREWDKAFDAYNALPPCDSGDTDEERRYEAAREAAYDFEDRLLAITPPNAEAALYQLKLFGERFHGLDFDDETMVSADEPGGPILRRIQSAFAQFIQ